MPYSIQAMPRPIRRRLKRTVQKSPDRDHVRRAMALLRLYEGHKVSQAARLVCAARSTVGQWRGLYEEYGEAGLEPGCRGRSTEVFYVDEADVDFNPRIGSAWTRRGEQIGVPTPGQNIKHYLVGALHAHSGRLVWVEHARKNTTLFIKLLEALCRTYRSARRLVLILDNYVIHKSVAVQRWLADNPKVRLLFQPTYSPWVNRIERLWKTLHDTITRNHRCATFRELARRIVQFLEAVQPLPGNQHALATLEV